MSDATIKALPYQEAVVVGASSVEIVPAASDSPRQDVYLKNTSAGGQTITLGLGAPAVANKGITLSPGDSVAWSKTLDYAMLNLPIFAVADAAGGQLSVMVRV